MFAVTQLSHHLLAHPTVEGALQTALLLAIVWLAWAYTTWVTNWLDPERQPVRAMLVVQMLVSLAMSIGLQGHAREALWLLGITIDLAGGAVGFYAPGDRLQPHPVAMAR